MEIRANVTKNYKYQKKKRCINKLIRCKALDKVTKSTYVANFLHSIKVKVQTGRQILAINYPINFIRTELKKKKKRDSH